MAALRAHAPRWFSSRNRIVGMVVIGVAVGVLTGSLGSWTTAPLVGWDAAAVAFSASVWISITGMDAGRTAAHATREDPPHAARDLVVLLAALASLVAVGVVLVAASSATGGAQDELGGLGVLSVAVSWWAVHTQYTLRYAALYYSDPVGGVDFNSEEPPQYGDFAYLAFTLGMTFQVSDTDVSTREIRATVLRHALLSYLFGSVVLATAINLVVSLASGSS